MVYAKSFKILKTKKQVPSLFLVRRKSCICHSAWLPLLSCMISSSEGWQLPSSGETLAQLHGLMTGLFNRCYLDYLYSFRISQNNKYWTYSAVTWASKRTYKNYKNHFLLRIHLYFLVVGGFFPPIRFYLNLFFFSTKHDHFNKRQWPNSLSCVPVTSRSSQVVAQELLHCATIWQQTGKSLLCQLSPFLGLTAGKCNSQNIFRISLSMMAFPKQKRKIQDQVVFPIPILLDIVLRKFLPSHL